MRSRREIDTWAATSAEARCPPELVTRLGLAFIVRFGATTVARKAGASPNSNVVVTVTRVVNARTRQLVARSSVIASDASAPLEIRFTRTPLPNDANATP